MTSFNEGERVRWEFGDGMSAGTASGTVLETDLDKFGYDDILKVQNDNGQVNHIRPKDTI